MKTMRLPQTWFTFRWAVLVCAAIAVPAAMAAEIAMPPATVSVQGEAEVRVAPDEVLVTVAVQTRHPEVAAAKLENDRRIRAASEFLREQGLPERNVRTDMISITPEYRHEHSPVEPVAYTVTRQLVVRIEKIDAFEDIFSGLVERGVNLVEGIEFRTTKLRQHRDEARRMAIVAAREKAAALAQALDASLEGVQSINENTWGGIYRQPRGMMTQNAVAFGVGNQGSEGAGGLSAGELTINAQVQVSFTLKDTSFDEEPARPKESATKGAKGTR